MDRVPSLPLAQTASLHALPYNRSVVLLVPFGAVPLPFDAPLGLHPLVAYDCTGGFFGHALGLSQHPGFVLSHASSFPKDLLLLILLYTTKKGHKRLRWKGLIREGLRPVPIGPVLTHKKDAPGYIWIFENR